jgi:zinc protease
MKRLVMILLACGMALPVRATPPALPNFPPIDFKPPKPNKVVLSNGLTVFLLRDPELPLIKVQALVRAGSQYDPADKTGLSAIFGAVLPQGGSERYKPEEIRRTLDLTGANISFSVDMENASGMMESRSGDFDKVLPLFADLLMHPRFASRYVDLEKDKQQEALRRMNDEPNEIGRREFRKLVYGPMHPYARTPDPKSINGLRRRDLLAMHQRFFKPNTTALAVSGDFELQTMRTKLEQAFGSWAKGDVTYPEIPVPIARKEQALYYVQRPINQSQIRIGEGGLARHNVDHFAWEVFNELWGGSAASRLFRTVRTQKGLAYQVASVFTEYFRPGMIVAICQTRGPETPEAVRSILEINQSTRKAPFTREEMDSAKEAIRNRFVANYTSSAQIAGAIMSNAYFGYPDDYLDTYTSKIGQVGLDDLKRVGETYLHPDRSVILIVGDLSTFNKPLSTLGRPQEIRLPDYRLESMQP